MWKSYAFKLSLQIGCGLDLAHGHSLPTLTLYRVLQNFSLINSKEFWFYKPSTIWSVLIPVSAIWNNAHFISIWVMPTLLVWESFVCSPLCKTHLPLKDRVFPASVLESMYMDTVSSLLISVFRITFSCPWAPQSPCCWPFLVIWRLPFSLWLLPYWLPWEDNGNTSLSSPKHHWSKTFLCNRFYWKISHSQKEMQHRKVIIFREQVKKYKGHPS